MWPAAADAESPMYRVQMQSFDMWCQETQHYPAERCDARTPADEEAYNTWRATIERYELPYLKRVEEERELNDRIIEHDSSARPVTH
jgi:hypothetical protein